jgi:iron complex transport system substrate-binding protein
LIPLAVALAALALLAAACGERSEPTGTLAAPYPVTENGAGDTPVVLTAEPQRIVALDAGSAELIEALGAGDRLLGAPAGAGLEGSSAVTEVVKETGQIDVDAVAGLDPDLVVATPEIDRVTLSQIEARTDAPVYVQPSRSIADVRTATLELGFLLGQPVEARQLAGSLDDALAAVEERIASTTPVTTFLDRGFLISVPDDSLTGDLIAKANGTNVAADSSGGVPFPIAELQAADPAVYLVTSDSDVTLDDLRKDPDTRSLSAVRNGRVVEVPVELVTRAGPRVVQGLEAIAAALHPDAFR